MLCSCVNSACERRPGSQWQLCFPVLFAIIPHFFCSPWATPDYAGLLVETSRKGLLCLPGFLAKWAYTTAVEPRRTLAYAYYLGCGFFLSECFFSWFR